MKRLKLLICLLLVLAGICFFIGIEKTIVHYVEKINTVDKEIINIPQDKVTEVSWTNEGKTLTFIKGKEEAVWQDKTDAEFPVSQEKFESFLEKFKSVHASFIIEDVKDYAQYGLDSPVASLEIVCGEEKQNITFGTFSTMDSKRYVKTVDGIVYLIDDDLVKYLSPNRDEFMSKDELYNYSIVEEISIQGKKSDNKEAPKLDIKYLPNEVHSYDNTVKYYLVDEAKYRIVDEKRMKDWLQKLTGSDFTSYATYTAREADLARYGLDNPAIDITIRGSMEDSNDNQKVPESYKVAVSTIGNNEYYLRVDNSKIIYKIEQSLYDDLCNVNYNNFRPTSIANLDWEKVSALTVDTGENEYEIIHDKKEEYHLGESTLEMKDTIDKISALAINDFEMKDMEEQTSNALKNKPEISLKFKLNIEAFSELKINFYSLSGTYSVVQINGETIGFVRRQDVTGVREAVICAILDGKK